MLNKTFRKLFVGITIGVFAVPSVCAQSADSYLSNVGDTNIVIGKAPALCSATLNLKDIKKSNKIQKPIQLSSCAAESTEVVVVDQITTESDHDDWYIYLDDDSVDYLARLTYFEAVGECDVCQRRVISVVLNRMKQKGLDVYSVIHEKNAFETADMIPGSVLPYKKLEQLKEVVREVCKAGPTLPYYVTYFRADHFHRFKDQIPYVSCCNTYVSYSPSEFNLY